MGMDNPSKRERLMQHATGYSRSLNYVLNERKNINKLSRGRGESKENKHPSKDALVWVEKHTVQKFKHNDQNLEVRQLQERFEKRIEKIESQLDNISFILGDHSNKLGTHSNKINRLYNVITSQPPEQSLPRAPSPLQPSPHNCTI